MTKKEVTIEVRNLEVDTYASIMLNDFKEQFVSFDGVRFLSGKKLQRKGEKCDLAWLANFGISVGAGVISGIIIELAKSVYAHHLHPKDYRWELYVKSDRCLKITVYKKDGVILVDVQDEDQKDN